MSSGPAAADSGIVVSYDADWNDAWYLVCMKVSTIGFVVVDARERVAALDALRARGVTDLSGYLDANPGAANRLRRGMIILDVNEAAVRMFGAAGRADMIGQRTQRFFDPSCTAQVNSARAFAEGAAAFQQQARSVRMDGSRFDTLFCVVPRADGVASGLWLASFVDITEHVQRQTALDALRDELAHVSRISTLGELSASIAHELGQPLSSIGMTAGAMLRRLDGPEIDRDTLRHQCRRIVDQVARAGDIIDRTRRMAGKRGGLRSPVAIADVLAESIQFVQHELSRHAIDIQVGVSGPDLVVQADRIQLQQVFVNLLMNAIQVHHGAGTPRPEIRIDAIRKDGTVRVDVADNGPGIEPSHVDQLFDGFFTTRADGLGLGLSICRTIIAAHDGAIAVTSPSGSRGATFSVCLPIHLI
ncbi:sensor histidine kinase [Methylobacterium radiodurans]|uniref:histidine kinase n=1 Tax=Methylobacterium radiodurans TaxID=2202828 RepID=A0A2U8VTQ8_9HYPH|nr:ATP-binding protein [Methylobacterium radiodurans]AWN37134.1 two-component sensor histidine kinase [Methylobacterium radiodurans]